MPIIRLVTLEEETERVPLGVLGYCLTRSGFLEPVWDKLDGIQKTIEHSPSEKLQDILVGILAGCRSLQQVNTRLVPDLVLAHAWGRARFADQSTLSRTLDRFEQEEVEQLRTGTEHLFRKESGVMRHNLDQEWLWLDIDLTPLPCSKRAEAGTKGKFPKKTRTAGKWHGFTPINITKHSFRASIQANRTVVPPTSRF